MCNACRRHLSKQEKSAYINAVKCLQAKPAITPTSIAPGVVSRYEDFVTTHILQTLSIHFVVSIIDMYYKIQNLALLLGRRVISYHGIDT